MGLQHRPRHHGHVQVAGDRGRPHSLGHALSGGPALGRAVNIRGAHVVHVHDRPTPVQ